MKRFRIRFNTGAALIVRAPHAGEARRKALKLAKRTRGLYIETCEEMTGE